MQLFYCKKNLPYTWGKSTAWVILPSTKNFENHWFSVCQRWLESHFQSPIPSLFQNFSIWIRVRKFKFENPTPVQTPATIDPTKIYQCFHLRNDLADLLLPKLKSDSGSGSSFSQNFDSEPGSRCERKRKNPAGVDSGTPDPWPPLVSTFYSFVNNLGMTANSL